MKLTRIAYNSAGWRRPEGDARRLEARETFSHQNGFGMEEWLFRSEWIIAGWRYAFLQGVNKGRGLILKNPKPFDVKLFTIEPDKRRRLVATIRAVECLDDAQAIEAVRMFKKRGWFKTMQREIADIEGEVSALGETKWAEHVLNIRYRLDSVTFYKPDTFVKPDDPIMDLKRYQLYDAEKMPSKRMAAPARGRRGAERPPELSSIVRRSLPPVEYTPEHAKMQAKLMAELRREFPGQRIVREEGFVDVKVKTAREIILFEIKSDLEPRTVIRLALGQLLEYALYDPERHRLPLRLVIVGRRPLDKAAKLYLERLRANLRLPLEYRVVEL